MESEVLKENEKSKQRFFAFVFPESLESPKETKEMAQRLYPAPNSLPKQPFLVQCKRQPRRIPNTNQTTLQVVFPND